MTDNSTRIAIDHWSRHLGRVLYIHGKTLGAITHGQGGAQIVRDARSSPTIYHSCKYKYKYKYKYKNAQIVRDARSSPTIYHSCICCCCLLLLANDFQLMLLLPSWTSSNFPDTRPGPLESFQAPAESLRSHLFSVSTKV